MINKAKDTEKADVEAVKKVVGMFGSMGILSRALEVSTNTVFNWCHGKTSPSPLICMRIEILTDGKVKARDILPDFEWEKYIKKK